MEAIWSRSLNSSRHFETGCGFHADTPLKYFAARDRIRGKNPELQAAMDSFMKLHIKLYKCEDTKNCRTSFQRRKNCYWTWNCDRKSRLTVIGLRKP